VFDGENNAFFFGKINVWEDASLLASSHTFIYSPTDIVFGSHSTLRDLFIWYTMCNYPESQSVYILRSLFSQTMFFASIST